MDTKAIEIDNNAEMVDSDEEVDAVVDPRYKEGKVYKIWNTVDLEIYIGSTIVSLCRRMTGHRYAAKTYKSMIYQHMRQVGVKNCYIEQLEFFPCNSKKDLLLRERHWIQTINPSLNAHRPIRTQAENKEIRNEQSRGWMKKHPKKHAKSNLDYYYRHRDKISEQRRKNKVHIRDRERQKVRKQQLLEQQQKLLNQVEVLVG